MTKMAGPFIVGILASCSSAAHRPAEAGSGGGVGSTSGASDGIATVTAAAPSQDAGTATTVDPSYSCGTLTPNLSTTCNDGSGQRVKNGTDSIQLSNGQTVSEQVSDDCSTKQVGQDPTGPRGSYSALCTYQLSPQRSLVVHFGESAYGTRRCGYGKEGSDVQIRSKWTSIVHLDPAKNFEIFAKVAVGDLSSSCSLLIGTQSASATKDGAPLNVQTAGGDVPITLDCTGTPGQSGLLVLGCYGYVDGHQASPLESREQVVVDFYTKEI